MCHAFFCFLVHMNGNTPHVFSFLRLCLPSTPGNLLLHNPITYFNCFGVQAGMHEPQVVLDIQCEWGCGAHRNRTLPWDIALLFQWLLVLEAIPGRAVGGHLRPIQRGFANPGGTTAKATWLRFSTVACICHGVIFSNVLCHVVQHYAQGHCRITKEATSYIMCKPQVESLHSIVWLCYDHGAVLDALGHSNDERIQDVRAYFPSSLIRDVQIHKRGARCVQVNGWTKPITPLQCHFRVWPGNITPAAEGVPTA